MTIPVNTMEEYDEAAFTQSFSMFHQAGLQQPHPFPTMSSPVTDIQRASLPSTPSSSSWQLHPVPMMPSSLTEEEERTTLPRCTTCGSVRRMPSSLPEEHTPSSRSRSKKRIRWTKDEHRLFVEGLSRYGRGDWKSISKNLLPSKDPSQIASHAQKYFNRQSVDIADRKRRSIHDITTQVSHMVVVPHRVDSHDITTQDLIPSATAAQQQQQQQGVQQEQSDMNSLSNLSQQMDMDGYGILADIHINIDESDLMNICNDIDLSKDFLGDPDGQICIPPDWDLIIPPDATMQQQPSLEHQEQSQPMSDLNPSSNFSQHMDGFDSISDIATEESHGSHSPLSDCNIDNSALEDSDLLNCIDFSASEDWDLLNESDNYALQKWGFLDDIDNPPKTTI